MTNNENNIQELPLGFAVELGKQNAMNKFYALPKEEKNSIVEGARNVNSKNEMQSYVSNAFK